jgi:hypothetical protein
MGHTAFTAPAYTCQVQPGAPLQLPCTAQPHVWVPSPAGGDSAQAHVWPGSGLAAAGGQHVSGAIPEHAAAVLGGEACRSARRLCWLLVCICVACCCPCDHHCRAPHWRRMNWSSRPQWPGAPHSCQQQQVGPCRRHKRHLQQLVLPMQSHSCWAPQLEVPCNLQHLPLQLVGACRNRKQRPQLPNLLSSKTGSGSPPAAKGEARGSSRSAAGVRVQVWHCKDSSPRLALQVVAPAESDCSTCAGNLTYISSHACSASVIALNRAEGAHRPLTLALPTSFS